MAGYKIKSTKQESRSQKNRIYVSVAAENQSLRARTCRDTGSGVDQFLRRDVTQSSAEPPTDQTHASKHSTRTYLGPGPAVNHTLPHPYLSPSPGVSYTPRANADLPRAGVCSKQAHPHRCPETHPPLPAPPPYKVRDPGNA